MRRKNLFDIKEQLSQRETQLKERIKELKGLYFTSMLVQDKDNSIVEIAKQLSDRISFFWQYPEITCARVIFDEQEFKSGNFKETRWKLSSDIIIFGLKRGMIEVYYLKEKPTIDEGPFLKEERNLIDTMATILAQGFESRLTERKLKERIKLEDMIINLSKEFINFNEDNFESIIETSLEKIARFIRADYSYIYLLEEDSLKTADSFRWWKDEFKINYTVNNIKDLSIEEFPWLLKKTTSNQLIDITDINQLPPQAGNLKKLLSKQNVKSSLIMPLKSEKDFIGIIGFNIRREQREWNKEELSLFKVIADIFINAIKRKRNQKKLNEFYCELEKKNMELERLYDNLEEEFEKGSKLHQQFLPDQLPEIKGIEYDTYFQPSSKLGGDFYGLIKIGNKLLFYLSDVSGHGLDSSLLNIFLREKINNYLLYHQNEELFSGDLVKFIASKYRNEDFPADYFICLLVGVLDLKDMKFNFANAGFQIPPMIVNKQGDITALPCGGMPISAVIDSQTFAETNGLNSQCREIEFKPDDLLFLTTDGLVEEYIIRDKQEEQYGQERLKEVLCNHHDLSVDLIKAKVIEDFKEFSGSQKGQDDITFLALKR